MERGKNEGGKGDCYLNVKQKLRWLMVYVLVAEYEVVGYVVNSFRLPLLGGLQDYFVRSCYGFANGFREMVGARKTYVRINQHGIVEEVG
jgi:hypothetical protein